MNKKIIAGIMAATLCTTMVVSVAGCAPGAGSDHEFTVLAVKEEAVKDYNDMQVFKDIAAASGKDVYWTFKTGNQYNNTLDKAGISGVDAIYHAGFTNLQLNDYGKRNKIVKIDEYLDSMPNFKKILDSRPDIYEALKAPDGHIYSLPRVEEMGLKTYPNILFINKKWIKKLIDENKLPAGVSLTEADLKDGLDLSREEFKAILTAFKNNNMDDKIDDKDEVPLAFVSDNWQGNESDLISSFGIPENKQHKTLVDGKITFTVENPKWFEAIKELNLWYNAGLIKTASYDKVSQDQETFLAKGQDGRYGAFYWWEKETVLADNIEDDYIIVLPLKDDDGNRYVGPSNELEVEKAECVILGACQDKAGLLSYFDKFFEPEFSAQLNYGSIAAGAYKTEKDEKGRLVPNEDHGAQSADDFRRQNAPYGVVYLTPEVFETSVVMESRAQLRQDRLKNYVIPYSYPKAEPIPNLFYTEPELKLLSKHEATLGKNITGWMTRAIIGSAAPTEDSWKSLINENKESIEAVRKTNQDAYDRYVEKIKK